MGLVHVSMINVLRMPVSARPANFLPSAATIGPVDLREGSPVRAGTYPFSAGEDIVTGWHSHQLHQVEYALSGVVEVETETAHYLLPPQQAVWIPAGLSHCTTLRRVRTMSVFFEPSMIPAAGGRARVLAAAPVIREMLIYGGRWPISRPTSDPVADTFFEALANLVLEWFDREIPLSLPTSSDPLLAAVMAYTNAHLDAVALGDVCRAVGVSERSLRRAFSSAVGMSWRQYLLTSRLLRSMALLAEPRPSVLEVSTCVGFESVSAFGRAFSRYTGETPTAYRGRVARTADRQ
jgi:AraC-like DNA-binding protein/mannose-6-phosphate isomerase-like protein (cupin superfamily)